MFWINKKVCRISMSLLGSLSWLIHPMADPQSTCPFCPANKTSATPFLLSSRISIGSMYLQMYGIFAYIWLMFMVNVVQYIYQFDGSYGICTKKLRLKKINTTPVGQQKKCAKNSPLMVPNLALPNPTRRFPKRRGKNKKTPRRLTFSFIPSCWNEANLDLPKTNGWFGGSWFGVFVFFSVFMLPEISMGFFNRWIQGLKVISI